MITGYIYSLQCPETNIIKYIGATIYPHERFKCHLRSPKYSNKPLQKWIEELVANDKKPIMSILHKCKPNEMKEFEYKFYSLYKDLGYELFNEKGFTHSHNCIDTVKLKKVMRQKGITQSQVASHIGYNNSAVSEYFRNKCSIRIEKAKQLSEYILSY